MPYIDKDKLLSSISKEDFKTLVESFGEFKCRKGSNNSMTTTTALCHGGNSPYKLYYYPDGYGDRKIGLCVCMTCGEKYDLVQFVIRAFKNTNRITTWYRALAYNGTTLNRIDEVSVDEPQKIRKIDDFSWINRIKAVKSRDNNEVETKEIDENILDMFTYIPHESWLNDGCNEIALNRYEISYSASENSIVIPHRDMNGRLIGIRGRYLSEDDIAKGKYRPLTIEHKVLSHPLGNHLYGLNIVKDYVIKVGKILIAEGEKSCVQAYTMFCQDGVEKSYVVAACGSSISSQQIEIIKSLNLSKVIYAPDKEYAKNESFEAEAWYNKQVLKLEPLVLYCQVYLIADTENLLEHKQSPFDQGLNTFLKLYEEKIEITIEEVNRVKNEMKGENK